MKILKIYILFVLVSLIIGVGSAFNTPIENFDIDEEFKENESTEIVEEFEEPVKEEILIEESKVEEKVEVKKEETKKETPKVQEQPKQNQKQETKTVSSDSKNEKTEETKEETKKETGPWEKYGMSEYDYYNKPLYSWERVDFAIEKYGSESNCRKACIEYGNNYEPYLNGEVAYHCSIVTSKSGRYLGEYFSTEKLN